MVNRDLFTEHRAVKLAALGHWECWAYLLLEGNDAITIASTPLPAQIWNNKSGTDFLLTDLMPSPVCSHTFVIAFFKMVNQYNEN